MNRMVINRDGVREPIDVDKIREKLIKGCEGLDINMVELESHIDTIYQENITTKRIQESLINLTVSMTNFESSHWTNVGGRLLMMEIEREVYHGRGYAYNDFYKTITDLCKNDLYDNRLLDYTEKEINELNKHMVPDRDMNYDYAGANMFVNRYLTKYRGEVWELPQEVFMAVSMMLSLNEKKDRVEKVKKFYDVLSQKKISLATPILANLRVPNGNLASCFISAVDDNIESIFYNVDSVAKISKNGGGVGVNLSRIRGKGSVVNGYLNASGGVIPWIKIINDTAVAVNQQGRRAGAVTVALDTWHIDMEQFLELQSENGDQRGKSYDVYPQVVVSDLFMKRVEENQNWTLFDPYEVRKKYDVELCELYGDEFEDIYRTLEKDESLQIVKKISARELLKEIMKTQIETGMPYIFFKDTANRLNHNPHRGMIGNGNLCMESFSNFSPTKKFTATREDNIGISKNTLGEVHTCNLLSLNLAEIEDIELEEISILAVRLLDNTIELTKSPLRESDRHNELYRTVGVGAMGLSDYLAYRYLMYEESAEEVDKLFEKIALYTLKGSALLARERGQYKLFSGSSWDRGIFFGKEKQYYIDNSEIANEWAEVFEMVAAYGIRNGELTAVAPNTSTSLLMGATASVNPVFSRFFIEKNQKGAVPRVVKHLNDRSWFYSEAKKIDPKEYVHVMSKISRWITQGVSMELLYDLNKDIKAKDIYDTIMTAWKTQCKSIYYTRTIQKNSNIVREKEECESCSG
ncbi:MULTISPECIES: ribonucleoside-diphosphate reductase subunit alpha [Psychrilyobacter]|uniref:Ribonucleoside-diphosphate reductase n=1 Tax=Psychrilyobacter piezotolerans TaxID=2293438 RepID=A0ABX9KID5_9FUSO|nr:MULTISPECIES: ribonucleoside-diphosphate reductase subunit alpha [Psychrilyobacter]MCS5421827.1 ribonucleoside-diphosphate reductase subunit alpha [Psychrilyobacter sp. S5]NDI77575.1 ribonucleoside-diphosphate reductase subunit alpha [Psychrilyobacter piezotolerans]RDE62915.1 ribonucleoside-diphosphate reductase subunit alpha [Psychrilyobacter sp. S5]REI41673.1 ribonucleoside-diphosphate reductase subunit alpha [Psychrilyobacter piezotolerans]